MRRDRLLYYMGRDRTLTEGFGQNIIGCIKRITILIDYQLIADYETHSMDQEPDGFFACAVFV